METLNVLIRPNFHNPDNAEGGIRRVVEAQRKWLPSYGITVIDEKDRDSAHVVMGHAGDAPHHDPAVPFISCNHGLYWTGDEAWNSIYYNINKLCIENMRRADAITAPSRWIAHMIARGMMRKAYIIPHGIEIEEWVQAEPQGYVLWNKARTDTASDEKKFDELVSLLPDVQFVTTFGVKAPNVTVTGRVTYPSMKKMVSHAGVYLTTTRETFGIGTLEAMAAGVPVVGYNHGGHSEFITNDYDGILVPPGDVKALADAVQYTLEQGNEVGLRGREKIIANYQWKDVIGLYANVIKNVTQSLIGPKTSIIVTSYNLIQYLPQCLYSILKQSTDDWECIVVDDASTDLTPEFMMGLQREHPGKFRYIRMQENVGLVKARNAGVNAALGKYMIFVDADDMLTSGAIEILSTALDKRPDLTVASGHLNVLRGTETNPVRNAWPFDHYDHSRQLKHINQIPYSSMIRRERWLDSGGYRTRNDRNEDAEQWCRLGSYGWKIEKVTQEPVLTYRFRGESKSQRELKAYGKEPEWNKWFTWKDDPRLTPYGSISTPPRGLASWPVRSFTNAQVSVIIPVGPGHQERVVDALDSLLAQTFLQWEAVVVNDTGEPLNLRGFPFVIEASTYRKAAGAGEARNLGVKASKAPLLFFLDADDMLFPDALRQYVAAWNKSAELDQSTIIYSDWVSVKGPDQFIETKAFNWDCNKLMQGAKDGATMLTSFLHSRKMFDEVGGFDETLPGWEDWDYHIKLVTKAGVCGWRIPTPLLFYRMNTGTRRDDSKKREGKVGQKGSLLDTIYSRYRDYYEGKKMCSCSGSSATVKVMSQNGGRAMNGTNPLSDDEMVLVEYKGGQGKMVIAGTQTGKIYGRRMNGDRFYVHHQDVDGVRFFPVTQLQQTPVTVMPLDTPTVELNFTPTDEGVKFQGPHSAALAAEIARIEAQVLAEEEKNAADELEVEEPVIEKVKKKPGPKPGAKRKTKAKVKA